MKTMSSYGFASRRTPFVSKRSVAMRESVRRSAELVACIRSGIR